MTEPVEGQFFPTKEELVNINLRKIAGAGTRSGLTFNVLPSSELAIKAEAVATQVLPVFANNKLGLQASSPLTAQGDDLLDEAKSHGVTPRPASTSSGGVRVGVVSVVGVTIPAGYRGTGPNGRKYDTVAVNTAVPDGATISVVSVEAGADTELQAGDVITWDSSEIGFLKRNATVVVGGITGGRDADDVETVRQRLLRRLQNPGVGGNWAHVAALAESASAAIDYAVVYPALLGAGSYSVAVVSNSGDRTLTDEAVNAASSSVTAELPGHANANFTTVEPEPVDLVLTARLQTPATSGGSGTGWRDSSPWPNETSGPVKVTSYLTPGIGQIITSATVLGSLENGKHIAIWDWEAQEMVEMTVLLAQVSGGFGRIAGGEGFSRDFTGSYISPGAVNMVSYGASALAAMRGLGPGEKSESPWVMPRARRRPTPDSAYPYRLESNVTTAIQDAEPTIQHVEFRARYATGTTNTLISPSVPANPYDPPNILTLKHLAFIAKE